MRAELLDYKGVASMLAVSVRTVWRWRDAGKIPPPVRMGRRTLRWRLADLESWIAADCPDLRRGEEVRQCRR